MVPNYPLPRYSAINVGQGKLHKNLIRNGLTINRRKEHMCSSCAKNRKMECCSSLDRGSVVVPGAGFEPAASGPMALQIMSFVP